MCVRALSQPLFCGQIFFFFFCCNKLQSCHVPPPFSRKSRHRTIGQVKTPYKRWAVELPPCRHGHLFSKKKNKIMGTNYTTKTKEYRSIMQEHIPSNGVLSLPLSKKKESGKKKKSPAFLKVQVPPINPGVSNPPQQLDPARLDGLAQGLEAGQLQRGFEGPHHRRVHLSRVAVEHVQHARHAADLALRQHRRRQSRHRVRGLQIGDRLFGAALERARPQLAQQRELRPSFRLVLARRQRRERHRRDVSRLGELNEVTSDCGAVLRRHLFLADAVEDAVPVARVVEQLAERVGPSHVVQAPNR
ncbi:unnamed protein product [Ixodes persulcatus]